MNHTRSVLSSIAICLLLAIFDSSANESQTRRKPVTEQSEFGSDSELDRPIPVPAAALEALRKAIQATPDELPADELQASEIHLGGTREIDFVVPGPRGAHARFFYILRPASAGYELIFESFGDGMTVLRTRSHGYRDLSVSGFSQAGKLQTTVVYRFNSRKYMKASEKTEHLD